MTVFQTLSPNDHVIAPLEAYHGILRLLGTFFGRWELAVDFVDMPDLVALKNAVNAKTKLVWVETPSNPTLNLTDIAAVAEDRASGRRASGLRQHMVADHSATIRARRGSGHAFDHEVFRWP